MLEMLVLAAALSVPAQPTPWRKPLAIYGGAGFADLASTEIALRRPGVVESNPLIRERGARLAIKAGTCFALVKVDQWAQRRSRGITWGLRGVWIAGNGYLVVRNLRQRQPGGGGAR